MTPWVTRLLVANVVAYVLGTGLPDEVMRQLVFVPVAVLERPWTPLTYMFLHGGIWHLGFNMLALFFFGPRLEARLGGRHFLGLYFVSGLVAAGFSFLNPVTGVIGASGAVFGVLLGFARYWPRQQILIWGVLPIEARWLVGIMTVLALLGGLGAGGSGVAHFAHLGGFAGGFGYLWLLDRSRRRGRGSGPRLMERLKEARRRAERSARRDLERWSGIDPEGLHEVNREHLEELRAKIEEEGVHSLSQRERDFLDRLSERSEG